MSEKLQIGTVEAHLLYLCGCALAGEKPDSNKLVGLDVAGVYSLSRFHSVSALVDDAINQSDFDFNADEKKLLAAFSEEGYRSVRKNLLLDFERQKLFSFLEENKIWYMPLKGVVLKDIYPKMGLRQMVDNDILFDASFREKVHDWFIENGYVADEYKKGNHDVYFKQPIYNFEMHVELYSEKYNSKWNKYYRNLKERLVKAEGSEFGLCLTDEDFYVFLLTHGFKHFSRSGVGLRFLIDLYVYLKAKQQVMDFDYVLKQLEILGIAEFEAECRALSQLIFGEFATLEVNSLDSNRLEALGFFISSGTHGTLTNEAAMGVDKRGKLGHLMWRIFPDIEFMRCWYPFFGKSRLLLPFGWIYRAFKLIFVRPRNVFTEISAIIKTKKKK